VSCVTTSQPPFEHPLHTVLMTAPRTRSAAHPQATARVMVLASVALSVGWLLAAAGGFELLSNRNLPPGWVRYQPPWTVPALVIGLSLVAVGLAGLAWAVLARQGADRTRRRVAK
jgi:hypothetical protein